MLCSVCCVVYVAVVMGMLCSVCCAVFVVYVVYVAVVMGIDVVRLLTRGLTYWQGLVCSCGQAL